MQPLSPDSRAIFWAVMSSLGATAMTISVHELAFSMDSRMIVFWRCFLMLLLLAPLLLLAGAPLRVTRPWLHILRGLLMAAALNLGFYALAHLPVAKATVLFFLAPAFTTLLAWPILGERPRARRLAAVLAGFVGAQFILQPDSATGLELAMLAAVACAFCFAVSLLVVKRMAATESSWSILLSGPLVAGLCSFPVALPVWQEPTADLWWWLLLLTAGASLRMFSDIRAYSSGEAGFIAPFLYLRLVFVGIAGYFLFAEVPDGGTLLGSAIIIGAMLFIAWREAVLRKRISADSP